METVWRMILFMEILMVKLVWGLSGKSNYQTIAIGLLIIPLNPHNINTLHTVFILFTEFHV